MLSNVADLTAVLAQMTADRHPVTPELAATLSPYMRRQLRRFGPYILDMDDLPPPLDPNRSPFQDAA